MSVSEPCKHGGRFSAHMQYKVQVCTLPNVQPSWDATVWRRYSDFAWLFQRLQAKYPTIVTPPIPDKHAAGTRTHLPLTSAQGRFQDEFVEKRRLLLQRFLHQLLLHPTLYNDPDVLLFVQSENLHQDVCINVSWMLLIQLQMHERKEGVSIRSSVSLAMSNAAMKMGTMGASDPVFLVSKTRT